jgi:hypothetical protein
MTGSAALHTTAAYPHGRPSSRDPGRDAGPDPGLVGGGFELVPAEFRIAADELDQLLELELRRRRTEQDQARDPYPTTAPAAAAAMSPVPSWLADADRDWCSQHHQMLPDLTAAGPALRDTVADYRETDTQLAASLTAHADDYASASLTTNPIPSSSIDGNMASVGWGDPAAMSADDQPSRSIDLPEPTIGHAGPTSLSEALDVLTRDVVDGHAARRVAGERPPRAEWARRVL